MPPDELHLRYLLRADQGVFQDVAGIVPATSGTNVRYWKDQSSNHLDVGCNSAGPILQAGTFPSIHFSGNEYFNFTNAFIGTERTIYAVLRVVDSGILTIVSGGLHALQWRVDGFKMRLVEASIVDIGFATTAMSSGVWTQINVSWNGTAGVFKQGGSNNGSVSASYSAISSACRMIGFNKAANGEYFKGNLALLMEYSWVHDVATRQAVEAWINSIWGI